MFNSFSNISVGLDETIIQQCREWKNQNNPDATMNNTDAVMNNPDAVMNNTDAVMNSMDIMMSYYKIHNEAADAVDYDTVHRVYVEAKQIIIYFSLQYMRYQDYMDWVFQKLRTADKPNDPLYRYLQQYQNGQVISFAQLFGTLSVEEMNYLGD